MKDRHKKFKKANRAILSDKEGRKGGKYAVVVR